MFRIVRRKEMAGGKIILNEIKAPIIAQKAEAGQFVILKANDTGERIPLTMAGFDANRGTITIIYSVAGRSTLLFRQLQVGDSFQNITGPLGRPTQLNKVSTAICVGGGTGVAVLYPIVKRLKQMGSRVICILGARSKELLILEDEMNAVSDELLICTDDGTRGRSALVTELLEEVLRTERPGIAVAIGPVPMMKRVSDITRPLEIKTLVSLNPIMIDGTGMCGSCRVEVDGKVKFACVDGPEFDGHKVDFDQLIQRLQAYSEEERQSLHAHWGAEIHRCKMDEIKVADLAAMQVEEIKAE
jgi:ferredoxin--NADP+ reductase